MLDVHQKITGIYPYIFGISSYFIFIVLGITTGLVYYLVDAKRRDIKGEGAINIVMAALVFGFLGSKIPLLFEGKDLISIISGKSIVGGLIGGFLGVVIIKKKYNIKSKLGNIIAPSIALGMAIGRIGCFLSGCCYGIIATWGFDFGDGVLRLPTQLFEVAFHFLAFIILHFYKNRIKTQGLLFKVYLITYFIFRFIIEFIRENPIVFAGMTIYQIFCGISILYMIFVICNHKRKGYKGEKYE